MIVPQDSREFSPRMVILITREKDQKKVEALFDGLHIPLCYQNRGKGTAPSEVMDILGLGGASRLITVGILPRFLVADLKEAATRLLDFDKRGGGIALTIPVTALQNPIYQMLNQEARAEWKQHMEERTRKDMAEVTSHMDYVVIWASVAGGHSDEVIDAARAAGARGGTVLRGRQRHSQRMSQRLGISVQEERDFVMIAVPREKKAAVMAAISGSCGLTSPAHGVVLSLPVDEAIGLEE